MLVQREGLGLIEATCTFSDMIDATIGTKISFSLSCSAIYYPLTKVCLDERAH